MGGGPAAPGEGGPPPATLRFSEDSKWVAFMVYPTRAEASGSAGSGGPTRPRLQLLTSRPART